MATLAEILAQKKLLKQQQSNTQVVEEIPVISTVEAVEAVADSIKELEKIEKEEMSLDDLLDSSIDSMGNIDKKIAEEAAIVCADIIPRIRQLASLSEADLESEMKLLKNALMANPEAVALMLPTDVGELVQGLRRVTRESITAEIVKKASKAKPKAVKVDAKTLWSTDADDF